MLLLSCLLALSFYFEIVSLNCSGMPWTCHCPALASWVAGTIGICHQWLALLSQEAFVNPKRPLRSRLQCNHIGSLLQTGVWAYSLPTHRIAWWSSPKLLSGQDFRENGSKRGGGLQPAKCLTNVYCKLTGRCLKARPYTITNSLKLHMKQSY